MEFEDDEFSAEIEFNAGHAIFSGHFPGQPIVPGVCLIHIVKDITTRLTGRAVQLNSSGNIKFLNVIDPRENPEVIMMGSIKREEDSFVVSASISNENVTFFKFKGLFQ